MAELFLHYNVAEVLVSMMTVCAETTQKPKPRVGKRLPKICKQDPETALFYIIGLIRV